METSPRAARGQHLSQGIGSLLGGDGVVRIAKDVDTASPERGRGELGPVVGRPADIDQPAPCPEGHRRRRGGLAEDRIDDNIDRPACGGGQPVRQTGSLLIRSEHDHVISAAADGPLRGGLRPADGDHPAGPQMPGNGERHLTHDSARAEHDHALAGA